MSRNDESPIRECLAIQNGVVPGRNLSDIKMTVINSMVSFTNWRLVLRMHTNDIHHTRGSSELQTNFKEKCRELNPRPAEL